MLTSWADYEPFIVTGLALGGVYAMSGVGMVVLYRATGVLNLAFGAVGAAGAFLAWSAINDWHQSLWLGYGICVLFGAVVTLGYGLLFGRTLAARDPLVKATATLGLALILLGAVSWIWNADSYSLLLPTSLSGFTLSGIIVNWSQVIALALGVVLTGSAAVFLRQTKVGTAMRALADDREITATLGVPVRRVESAAWLGSGILSGVAGVLLANLVSLDAVTLTFLIVTSLAAALVARLQSLVITFGASIVIGLITALATPFTSISAYRNMAPFIVAVIALLFLSRRPSVGGAR